MEDPLNRWVLGSGPWFLKQVGTKVAIAHEDGEWKVTKSNKFVAEGRAENLEAAKAAADEVLNKEEL